VKPTATGPFARWRQLGAAAIAGALAIVAPARAAEEIRVFYSILGISLKVESLATYAETGVADRQLQFYLSRVPEERRDQFREALTRSYDDLDPLYLYYFFRTPTGESMLQQIGTLIELPGGINGGRSLRGALVGAALSPEGLSLLNVLQQFPVAIELDAFGSGHCSIITLIKLGPDALKIDRELIYAITEDQARHDLVRSIIEIGRSLNVRVVAEGVETMRHAEILSDLGCDVLQGFLFARPLPAAEVPGFIANWARRDRPLGRVAAARSDR